MYVHNAPIKATFVYLEFLCLQCKKYSKVSGNTLNCVFLLWGLLKN